MPNVLFARQEFFGVILYNSHLGKYFQLSNEQWSNLQKEISNYALNNFISASSPFKEILNFENASNIIETRFLANEKNEANLSVPLKVFLNITKRCNLYCKHCYNSSGEKNSPELSISEIEYLFDCFAKHGIFTLTISGGEPLFHPQFESVIKALSTTPLTASLITNGISLTPGIGELLENSKNIESVTVSLDGYDSISNDNVRGTGSFDKAIKGIKTLKKSFTKDIYLRITLMKSNTQAIGKYIELASELGIRDIKVNPVNSYGRARNNPQLLLPKEEYLYAREQLYENALASNVRVQVPSFKYQVDKNNQVGLCKGGHETIEVNSDGNVYPCSFSFGNLNCGNIRTSSFQEILKNLSDFSINNEWCYSCKGRGGQQEQTIGYIPQLLATI